MPIMWRLCGAGQMTDSGDPYIGGYEGFVHEIGGVSWY